MAKSVTGFRLSNAEVEMIDAVAKHYRLDNRTEAVQWLVRREYFNLESLERRIAELEKELAMLKSLAQ